MDSSRDHKASSLHAESVEAATNPPDASSTKQDGNAAGPANTSSPDAQNVPMMGIRLLMAYVTSCEVVNVYRAYRVYRNFESWAGLSTKEKVYIVWGVVGTIVMAMFVVQYATLEYKVYKKKQEAKKAKAKVCIKDS